MSEEPANRPSRNGKSLVHLSILGRYVHLFYRKYFKVSWPVYLRRMKKGSYSRFLNIEKNLGNNMSFCGFLLYM